MNLFSDNASGAVFSDCRKYRYCLWRIWDEEKPLVGFIGLNPSTANETEPDPTITRVIGFAKDWGYGGVYMLNLFALVSKNPEDLLTAEDPLGDNDGWIEKITPMCDKVIFAWGAFKEAKARAEQVIRAIPNGYALIVNSDGSPRHPLYVRADTKPSPYTDWRSISEK